MRTTADRPAIDVRNLRMSYGDLDVLRGVDLEVRTGEVVVLLGPNGAGKSTTIEILEGFRAPSAGHVQVLGTDPMTGDDAWRARLGVVLQSWRDHARWRVWDLLHHLGEFYRPWSTAERPRPWDTGRLLERVGLGDKAGSKIGDLSGGQRRRLDVAVGLVGRPELLFLDEPTAGFDPEARRDFHDLVAELADSEVTVLLTTHDLDEAEKLADRILVLAGGRIVASDSPDALRHRACGETEVRWTRDGNTHVHATADPGAYLRGVLAEGDVSGLEVRRATLEDAYLGLVRAHGRTHEIDDIAPALHPVGGSGAAR